MYMEEKKIIKKSIRITEAMNNFIEKSEGTCFNDKLEQLIKAYMSISDLEKELYFLEHKKMELKHKIEMSEEMIQTKEYGLIGETMDDYEWEKEKRA